MPARRYLQAGPAAIIRALALDNISAVGSVHLAANAAAELIDRCSEVGAVTLSWEVHGGNATGVVVERTLSAQSNTSGAWEKIANVGAKANEYRDNTLPKGQKAAYRVRALNAAGESAYSNVVRITAE